MGIEVPGLPQFYETEYNAEKMRRFADDVIKAFKQLNSELGGLAVSVFSGAGSTGLVPDPVEENGLFLSDDGSWKAALTLADISVFSGPGGNGLVPDPTTSQGFFLRDDGTWAAGGSGGGGGSLDERMWRGYVSSDAASFQLPDSWTVTREAAGHYRVTHGLDLAGVNDLSVVVTPIASAGWHIVPSTDHFDVFFVGIGASFTGWVSSSAGSSSLPDGWNVVRLSAGRYRLTHNLGLGSSTSLRLIAQNKHTSEFMAVEYANESSNALELIIGRGSAVPADRDFVFVAVPDSADFAIDVAFFFLASVASTGLPPDPGFNAFLRWDNAGETTAWASVAATADLIEAELQIEWSQLLNVPQMVSSVGDLTDPDEDAVPFWDDALGDFDWLNYDELREALVPGAAYDVPAFIAGEPVNGALVFQMVVVRAFALPENLTGSQGYAGIAANAEATFDIQKNESSIGSVVFAAAGQVATFTFASEQVFAAGDRLALIAPSPADDDVADISITFAGIRS